MTKYGTDSSRFLDDDRLLRNHPMMWGSDDGSGFFIVHMILALITWVLVIVVLFALARWLWAKGDNERKRR